MRCLFKLRALMGIGLALGSLTSAQATVTRYVSFGMPDALLKAQFRAAGSQQETRVIFRGLPELGGYPAFIRRLVPLIQDLPKNERPPIGLDPAAFEQAGIGTVPVLEVDQERKAEGRQYPVTEPDPRIHMRKTLAALTPTEWRRALLKEAPQERKPPLPSATSESRLTVDPVFRLPQSIMDTGGRVLSAAGETANPLTLLPSEVSLLILDIDDQRQSEVVVQRLNSIQGDTWVLAAGRTPGIQDSKIQKLSDHMKTPILPLPQRWLDQFRISHLPVEVRTTNSKIEIRQWPP